MLKSSVTKIEDLFLIIERNNVKGLKHRGDDEYKEIKKRVNSLRSVNDKELLEIRNRSIEELKKQIEQYCKADGCTHREGVYGDGGSGGDSPFCGFLPRLSKNPSV